MSYWAKMKTSIKDLDALAAACQECGCTLYRAPMGQSYYNIPGYGQMAANRGEAAIMGVGLPYPILVKKQADGTYNLERETDFDSQYTAKLGKDLGKLVQLYGVNWATRAAQKLGHKVTRTMGQNGKINVVVQGNW